MSLWRMDLLEGLLPRSIQGISAVISELDFRTYSLRGICKHSRGGQGSLQAKMLQSMEDAYGRKLQTCDRVMLES
jgi:hypothetical protein